MTSPAPFPSLRVAALSPGTRGAGRGWLTLILGGVIAVAGFVPTLIVLFGPPLLVSVGSPPVALNASPGLVTAFAGLFLLTAGLGLGLLWRGQNARSCTEQARLSKALLASEVGYRSLFEANPHPMWVFDLETLRFLAVNDAAVDHYGYRRDEFLAMTIADIRPVEDLPRLVAHLAGGGATTRVQAGGWRHRTRDGTLIDVEITAHLLDFVGRAAKLVLAQDVTARNRIEGQVRRGQAQLTHLINAVDGIVWEANADTLQFTFVSPRAERLLGYPVARWTDEPAFWADHIHPGDREQAVKYCTERTRQKRDHEFEYRMVTADGREVWLRDIVSVAVENGRPAKLRGIMVDITESRAAEAALRTAEERLRLALSGATQGIWDFNTETGEVVVSSEYATMLGYDPLQFHETDATWAERLHPDDRETAEAAFHDYVAGRTSGYCVEFRQRTKSGDWKWILSAGKLVSPANGGQAPRMVGTHTDITGRKIAELRSQRLARLYAALSQTDETILRCRDEADLFARVCQIAVEQGGMAMAWIGVADEESGTVRPMARFGAGAAFVEGIQISVDPGDPTGRGPTGTAIRENRPCWVFDYLHDASTEPWHARGAPYGWVASGALPLTCEGRPVGALTLYTMAPGLLGDEDRRLLTEMAADISFALDNFAREKARGRAEEGMRALLREKEALLKEVHHRVKNNLQVIVSLLRLETARSSHPAATAALGEMQHRVQSMASLHEAIYRSNSFAQVDLSKYLRLISTRLFTAMAASPSAVALHFDLAEVHVDMQQALPCGLLINELVTNSLKHGFPEGGSGEVRLELKRIDCGPRVLLRVSDTGVGFPADFSERRHHSLGLQLVTDLARQLQGTLEIDTGPGAAVSLAFTPAPVDPESLAAGPP